MRVLVVHNHYQQRGGEDAVFHAEVDLLRAHGHTVNTWRVHNRLVNRLPSAAVALNTIWSQAAARKIAARVKRYRIELVHFHNTLPLLSPSVYGAARAAGAATVQTLHNYRMMCVNGLLMRDGAVCEQCVGKRIPWPAAAHRCYRGSTAGSATVAAMLTIHRAIGTWRKHVDRYIALTEFARQKHVAAGLPQARIALKPNFLTSDPGIGDGRGGYALFAGRLVQEKGVTTLLDAWTKLDGTLPLKIIGDGPMAQPVAHAAAVNSAITYLHHQDRTAVMRLMGDAAMVILPSLWYEGLPLVAIEAAARGTPLVCSNIGSLAELVADDTTGMRFRPGDATDLATKVQVMAGDPAKLREMRSAARAAYEAKYTAERNYEQLMAIYSEALTSRAGEA